jgi:hypothetical protein
LHERYVCRLSVRLGQRLCRTPEESKAWSQNLGHESEATEMMRNFADPTAEAPEREEIALIEAALKRLKSRAA